MTQKRNKGEGMADDFKCKPLVFKQNSIYELGGPNMEICGGWGGITFASRVVILERSSVEE